jgi:sterol O-acyltransferase
MKTSVDLKMLVLKNSSGTATPIPFDAPPSVHATSSARRQIRAIHKFRQFPTIEYAARVSHFDPQSDYRDFRGFFVLFWISLAIMMITTMIKNIEQMGAPFIISQWSLFTENIWELAISDLLMAASAMLSLPLHKLYMHSTGLLRWSKGGMLLQSLFQAAWLAHWIGYDQTRHCIPISRANMH